MTEKPSVATLYLPITAATEKGKGHGYHRKMPLAEL